MDELDTQQFGEEPQQSGAAEAGGSDSTARPDDFRTLIAGAYRQDYEKAVGQRIQSAIRQRFKNQQDYKKQLDAVQPILQTLSGRYGLAPDDAAGIAARLQAENGGAPQSTPAENPSGGDYLEKHIGSVMRQAEELRQVFPDFDLKTEMQNPAFVRLTAPGVGLSVKDAFMAVHSREIQRESMRYAARKARESLAASVMAGASRPRENGLNAPGEVHMAIDVKNMDKKTRAEYRRRIHNGEKINFVDLI